MRPRLPPLNALKAFEAAARHESFTRAAEELCVTQGAVSHQVKALEAELAIKLFNRERQRLVKHIETVYAQWSARGAHFLTPPKRHQYEIRCYIRDPDGHLIEVGQTTDPQGDWLPGEWPSRTPE